MSNTIGDPLNEGTQATESSEIEVDGAKIVMNPKDSKSILESLLEEGINPPYSCKAGICMACMAVVESGTVKQDNLGSLTQVDIQGRKILACQAVPLSKKVKIRFLG